MLDASPPSRMCARPRAEQRTLAAGAPHATHNRHQNPMQQYGTALRCADLDVEDLLVAQRGVAGQHLVHNHHLHRQMVRGILAQFKWQSVGTGCRAAVVAVCPLHCGRSRAKRRLPRLNSAHLLVGLLLPAMYQLVQQLDGRLAAVLLPVLALQVRLCRQRRGALHRWSAVPSPRHSASWQQPQIHQRPRTGCGRCLGSAARAPITLPALPSSCPALNMPKPVAPVTTVNTMPATTRYDGSRPLRWCGTSALGRMSCRAHGSAGG